MAAALPLSGLAAWRVHLGLPMSGSRLLAETDVPVSAVALASPGARLDFVALADEPGLEPAPQRADAALVDAAVLDWLRRHLERAPVR